VVDVDVDVQHPLVVLQQLCDEAHTNQTHTNDTPVQRSSQRSGGLSYAQGILLCLASIASPPRTSVQSR
jgi:hypothetical protein